MSAKKPRREAITLPPAEAAASLQYLLNKGVSLAKKGIVTPTDETAWEATAEEVLTRAFGADSRHLRRVMEVTSSSPYPFGGGTSEGYARFRLTSMVTRNEIVGELLELLQHIADQETAGTPTNRVCDVQNVSPRKVFLVHGHDHQTKNDAARLLERLGLEVTILSEAVNRGRTILQKFLDHSDVAFAVVLLTGDDQGGTKGSSFDEQKPRARQNVILELGYFLAKLGPQHVCALYETNVEVPSDYSGVLWVPLDSHQGWHLQLARELRAAGLNVDLNKLTRE